MLRKLAEKTHHSKARSELNVLGVLRMGWEVMRVGEEWDMFGHESGFYRKTTKDSVTG